MEPSVSNESRSHTILEQVREGMPVCDGESREIGSVRRVFFGSVHDKADSYDVGPVTTSDPDVRDDTLVDNLAQALAADEPLPETLRDRLLREGYIRIDTAGLFASDRFALPDQIASVSEDCVRLSLMKDELIGD